MSRIEDEVCEKIQGRAAVGKEKYGVTMETAPLTTLEWLTHAQEEAMDLSVYLQKIIERNQYPRRDVCWWCGGKLIWQADYDKEDLMDEEGIVTHLHCSSCNASVEYISQEEE
tara:strand:- start:1614 stop:1952 length:339 start_codon:yes stop_codon:yes gene_type:complete